MLEINKIYNMDCLEGMKYIDDKSIDIIITDPPWLKTECDFDKTDLNWNLLFKEYKRILKDNGWLFLFGTVEMAVEALKVNWKRKFEYIWIKPSIIPCTYITARPATQHEIIFAFIKAELKKVTTLYIDKESLKTKGDTYTRNINSTDTTGEFEVKNRRVPIDKNGNKKPIKIINNGTRVGSTVIYYPNKNKLPFNERTPHPTQKPVNLIELLIKGYCPPNGLVLDSFMGSGTTAIACINTNRNFIGFELNKEYYELAKNRINQHIIDNNLQDKYKLIA